LIDLVLVKDLGVKFYKKILCSYFLGVKVKEVVYLYGMVVVYMMVDVLCCLGV